MAEPREKRTQMEKLDACLGSMDLELIRVLTPASGLMLRNASDQSSFSKHWPSLGGGWTLSCRWAWGFGWS